MNQPHQQELTEKHGFKWNRNKHRNYDQVGALMTVVDPSVLIMMDSGMWFEDVLKLLWLKSGLLTTNLIIDILDHC